VRHGFLFCCARRLCGRTRLLDFRDIPGLIIAGTALWRGLARSSCIRRGYSVLQPPRPSRAGTVRCSEGAGMTQAVMDSPRWDQGYKENAMLRPYAIGPVTRQATRKSRRGALVFGDLPQAGLDDTLSPIKELVDLQKFGRPGIISQARQQFIASLQNLRKLQTMQHSQSLNQPPEFSKASNGEVAFLFRHHLLLHPGGAGFWLPNPSVRLCRGTSFVSPPEAVHPDHGVPREWDSSAAVPKSAKSPLAVRGPLSSHIGRYPEGRCRNSP
jgi:hypothetical protein